MILGIILGIVGVLFLIITIIHDDEDGRLLFGVFGIAFLFLGAVLLFTELQEKETSIRCLKGNNPYKQQIIYEFKHSIQIPVDTIYVKIK